MFLDLDFGSDVHTWLLGAGMSQSKYCDASGADTCYPDECDPIVESHVKISISACAGVLRAGYVIFWLQYKMKMRVLWSNSRNPLQHLKVLKYKAFLQWFLMVF